MVTTWDFYRSHVVFFFSIGCRFLYQTYSNLILFIKYLEQCLFIAIFACLLCGKVKQFFI